MDIQSLLREYSTSRKAEGFSSHTIERVNLTINMICRDMNLKNLGDLTTDRVLEWGTKKLDGSLGKAVSASGLYANYNSVRSFIKFLDETEVPHQLNGRRIHCKPAYKQRLALRPEEVTAIVRCADNYTVGLLIRLLFNGGMRISEALGLTLDDLKPDGTIDVVSKWAKARTIFIGEQMRQELEWNAKKGGYLFPDMRDPASPMNRKNAYYHIKRTMRRAGYGQYFPHAERHGYATDILRNGGDISSLRILLGHTDIATTQIYEHLMTDDVREAHFQYHTFV